MPSDRGPHPEVPTSLARPSIPNSERPCGTYRGCGVWSREYSGAAPQKLVGDRYQLKRRQRDAVARSARTDAERAHRLHARQSPRKVAGREVHIDAFNVLIPPEAALERAYLFGGRDTAHRDSTCVPQSLISL